MVKGRGGEGREGEGRGGRGGRRKEGRDLKCKGLRLGKGLCLGLEERRCRLGSELNDWVWILVCY